MNIETGYDYSYKGFRCDSCGSTHPYKIADSLESVSSGDRAKSVLMNVWAPEGYEDFRFPRACSSCGTALVWVLASSEATPNTILFEGLECFSCKSYYDKMVLSELKDYVNEDDEYGWRRITPEEAREDNLKWEAGIPKYEQPVEK